MEDITAVKLRNDAYTKVRYGEKIETKVKLNVEETVNIINHPYNSGEKTHKKITDQSTTLY